MNKENLSGGKAPAPQDKEKVSMSVDCDEHVNTENHQNTLEKIDSNAVLKFKEGL